MKILTVCNKISTVRHKNKSQLLAKMTHLIYNTYINTKDFMLIATLEAAINKLKGD